MTSLAFVGGSTPDVSTSFTDKWVETASGVSLPTNTRLAANGTRPVFVDTLRVYWAGRGASRKLRVLVGGISTPTYTIASNSSAVHSAVLTLNASFTGGGVKKIRIDADPDGSFYFGRATGTGSVDSYGTSFGALSGTVDYHQVPNAPTALTAVQAGIEDALNLSWTAPTITGGKAITGYQIEWSYNSDFSGSNIVGTGSASTTYKLTGVTYGSIVYVKVSAINIVAEEAGTTSVYSSSTSAYVTPPDLPLNGWANFGTLANNTFNIVHTSIPALIPETGIQRRATSTATGGSYTTGDFGIRKTYTNLQIGRQYILSGKAILLSAAPPGNIYRFAVTGIGTGTSVTLTSTTVGATIPSYTFTATATTHVVEIELAETFTVSTVGIQENVAFYDYALTRVATDLPYRLQDNAIEASLLDHFDLATQSVGAYWWVNRINGTKFTQDFDYSLPVGKFSDVIADGNLYYTDIQTSFDTSRVINDITLSNDGVRPTAFGSAAVEPYTVTWRETDTGSVTDWGARSYELNTNLRTPVTNYNLVFDGALAYSDSKYISGAAAAITPTRQQLSLMATGATGFLTAGTTQPVSTIGTFVGRANMNLHSTVAPVAYTGDVYNTQLYPGVPVVAGTQYTGSVYMRAGVGRATSLTGRATVRWYNEAGAVISDSNGTAVTITDSAWNRRTVTATAPAGAVGAVLFAWFLYGGTNNAGFRYYSTGAQLELGAAATTWVSGDTPDTATLLYEWQGQPGESSTIVYDNTIDTRALELLGDFSDPEVTVNAITFNTAQNPITSVGIDIASLVNIEFNGTTNLYRVVGIKHDITPERWMMTLQTAKVI
jgi:hypothetical protein